MVDPLARSWLEVSRHALVHNLGVVRCKLPESAVMAVVKADAYGHGAVPVAWCLEPHVEFFAVASVLEAMQLRNAGIEKPIFLPGALSAAERVTAAAIGLVATVSNLEEAQAYAELQAEVHLAVDTGMGRVGVRKEDCLALAQELKELRSLQVTGLWTHLPVADEDEQFTRNQLADWKQLVSKVRGILPKIRLVHVLNSAGVLGFNHEEHTMVRVGLMLYGVSPLLEWQKLLKPVATWKARVVLVMNMQPGQTVSYGRTCRLGRASRVATLCVGYADGWPRALSGKGADVLICGRRCPVLGRVTMDQIMVDVTDVPDATPGSEVVLMGRQGAEEISASELAQKAGTIAWEVFTGIQQRVVRVHVE